MAVWPARCDARRIGLDSAGRSTMSLRAVKKIIQSKPTLEGAGVHLRRAFGFGNTSDFDPFLLLDDFRNDMPEDYLAGFPWHPHRGIETITYVLAGTVEHGDSLGNRGAIGAGRHSVDDGRQRHHSPGDAEGRHAGRMHGFQLWANLPSSLKMTAPRYQEVKAPEIPEMTDDDGTQVRVVCGHFWGKKGPVDGDRRRPDLSRRLGAAGQAEDPARRNRLATRSRTSSPAAENSATPRARSPCRPKASAGSTRTPPTDGRQSLAGALRSRRRGGGAGRRRRHPLPARLRQAAQRAGRLVRPDRDEHAGATAPGVRRTAGRNVFAGATKKVEPRRGSRRAARDSAVKLSAKDVTAR